MFPVSSVSTYMIGYGRSQCIRVITVRRMHTDGGFRWYRHIAGLASMHKEGSRGASVPFASYLLLVSHDAQLLFGCQNAQGCTKYMDRRERILL